MTKFCNGNRWTLATLAATLMVSGVSFAQQATTADPYSGVSQPPPDSDDRRQPGCAAGPTSSQAIAGSAGRCSRHGARGDGGSHSPAGQCSRLIRSGFRAGNQS